MKYLWAEDTGAGFHFWKLVNQLFFDDALVVESKESKPDVEDGNEKMRMLIQSEEVHKIISTIIGYKKEGDKLEFHTL